MLAPSSLSYPAAGVALEMGVAGYASLRVTVEMMQSFRNQPSVQLPASILKHADEQTLAALMAVARTMAEHRISEPRFDQWGILAAPCLFGRNRIAQALQRFAQEGAWGISPYLIPHQSLHAVSGTLSQAFRIHGPNFGVDGNPGSEGDAFLVALTLLHSENLPGLWFVLTGFEPEWIPDEEQSCSYPENGTVCEAIALALTQKKNSSLNLRVYSNPLFESKPLLSRGSLFNCLSSEGKSGSWRLNGPIGLDMIHGVKGVEARP